MSFIFDIGANNGEFSKYMLENTENEKVIAIEPIRDFRNQFESLKIKYPDRFLFEEFAMGKSSKLATMYRPINMNSQTASLYNPNLKGPWHPYVRNKLKMVERIPVKQISTRSYFRKFKYEHIRLVKVDTQGTDIEILEDILSEALPDFIIIEVQASNVEESYYLKSRNTLLELCKSVIDKKYNFVKIIPNSNSSAEINLVLTKFMKLSQTNNDFVTLLINSPILLRFSSVAPIGEFGENQLFRKLLDSFMRSSRKIFR